MTTSQHASQSADSAAAANRFALSRLRRHWLVAAFLFAAVSLSGYGWLTRSAYAAHAANWLIWAGLAAVAVLAILWRALPHNHRKGESRLFPGLGYATWLSLVCAVLLVLLTGFLAGPMPSGWLAWAPALLYTAARLLDLLDGYVARLTNRVTALGATLDIELDGLGLLIAVVLGVQWGRLPVWYLVLAVSRQLFVAGMWQRKRRDKPVYELPPSENRRIIAGFQTGFLTVALWPILPPPLTNFLATLFAIPLIASFGRDWLVVSGAIDPDSAAYLRRRSVVKRIVEGWLPLAGRIIGALLGIALLWHGAPGFPSWQAHLRGAGMFDPTTLIWTAAILFALALPFFALGIAGRVAALFVMAIAFLDISAAGLDWSGNAWILIGSVVVAHFGSGYLARWQPEEAILHRRLGDTEPALQ